MTTILQSCLETQFIETTPLKLKVATPKSSEFSTSSSCNMSSNHDLQGWSFLQVLSNVSSTPKETMEKENVYVHPLTKQYSSSRLSEKSLELCTENLGSETGSDSIDISILSLSSSNSPTSENSWLKQEGKLPQEVLSSSASSSKYRVNNSQKFPPPLTTISGSNPLQFRPHREHGRLVIQAVKDPLQRTYFQAERSHGRLRLSFLSDHATIFDSQLTRTEENEADDSEDEYEVNEDCYQLEDDGEQEEIVTTNMSKDMDDNTFDVEVEMGRENFQRLMNSRCNEGRHGTKGLCNWPEPLWVVTS